MPPTGTCLISNISLPRTDVSRRDTEHGIPPIALKTISIPRVSKTTNLGSPQRNDLDTFIEFDFSSLGGFEA
ncbi:hypothetical protein L596_021249 [Steinernema carpocapsae]|uniref:Uncharacterized protein n=1 Tax=Steinernema carpocapsae TaxID=34508 RepID=A0A4U5MVW7_STECR|nr:hypothetical protein L596_021249 [Steinernema carpocapsae]